MCIINRLHYFDYNLRQEWLYSKGTGGPKESKGRSTIEIRLIFDSRLLFPFPQKIFRLPVLLSSINPMGWRKSGQWGLPSSLVRRHSALSIGCPIGRVTVFQSVRKHTEMRFCDTRKVLHFRPFVRVNITWFTYSFLFKTGPYQSQKTAKR